MEFFDAETELLRLAADFVQRRQPVVNIEGGILESLRHDRAGALLKFQNKMHVLGAGFVVQILRETKKQNVAQEIKDRFFDRRIAPFRRGHGAFNDGAIFSLTGGPGVR